MQARYNIVVALLSALVAVVMSSTAPDLINFRAKNLFPHGFEWHKTKNAFLVGSLTTGQVYTVTDDATVTQFTTDSRLYQRSAQGLELDYTRSQLLIALGNSSAANLEQFEWAKNAFARADISTGEVTAFVDLDAVKLESYKGTSLAGDLAVDSNGNVYICETRGGFIWKVDKQNNVTVYASHPDWTPEAQYIPGIKGMVYSNGNLLVSKQGEGKLFRVTVEADGVSPNITYVSFPSGIPDYFSGITLRENGNLVVVGRPPSTGLSPFIYELESNDNWVTAAIKYTVNATRSEPITAIPRENDVFVLHAYLNDFLAGRESFDITKAPYPISEQTTAASSTPEPSTDESGAPSQSGICVLVALIAAFLQLLL